LLSFYLCEVTDRGVGKGPARRDNSRPGLGQPGQRILGLMRLRE
jgi:hypothetical protein